MSDVSKIFKAYDIRGKVGSELSPELVRRVGEAFAQWLQSDGAVAVGHDMRPDSRALADELIAGLTSQGRDVWDLGLVTSDMVYFAPGKFDLAGGAMITASHNPGEYNGIKLCREEAKPIGLVTGLSDIRDRVLSDEEFTASDTPGTSTVKDISADYVQHIMSFIDTDNLKPFKIAIDAGNGMTGEIMPKFYEHLPVQIEELYFELDGTFPNHEANPMKVETLTDLSDTVTAKGYNFGIAFDGDGDRVALVDEKGAPVSGSMLSALLATYVLEKSPGGSIVHDLRMSRSTLDLIEARGGKAIRCKVGNTLIKQKGREENAAFGAEITGHLMFAKNYFVDSAILAALVAIEVLSKADYTLSEFVAQHDVYAHVPEINLEVEDKEAALSAIEAAFPDGKADWLDGLFINFPDGWLNVRPSNTEPVLRFNLEARTQEQVDDMIQKVQTAIGQ